MEKRRLTVIETATLVFVALMVALGFVLFYVDVTLFEQYIAEDGIVEWFTVAGLLLGAVFCFIRFARLLKLRSVVFLVVTLLLGLMLFVVAGEEISWGQRVLGIESSEFFKENNAQAETNLHNLVVNGVKVNKVVFTFGLIAALGVFLLIIPLLYRRNEKLRRWIDAWGILIPRRYQIIAFLVLFAATSLLPHEKNPELLECGAALLFFLIVRYPYNAHIYKMRTDNA